MLQIEFSESQVQLPESYIELSASQAALSEKLLNSITSFLQKLQDHVSAHLESSLELILGLSGGLDSIVLLDLLARTSESNSAAPKFKLSAVYIDHQLQVDSTQWLEFTRQLCEKYNVPFNSYAVEIIKSNSQSLEALARKARYSKFAELINSPNKILLTAHHLNDQAETFLLQLARSAGPRGLSAMPKIKKFAGGYHARPLLEIPRADIEIYARVNCLAWVEDKTNSDLKFDRNYLRHQILPLLSKRWPSILTNISNSAKKCAEHQELLDEYLAEDYKTICVLGGDGFSFGKVIDLQKLVSFSTVKQQALVSYWLRDNKAGLTERKIIDQIMTSCIQSPSNKNPQIIYNGFIVRRYKDKLYLLSSTLPQKSVTKPTVKVAAQSNLVKEWDYQLGRVLELPEKGLKISSYQYCPNAHIHHSHKAIVIPQTTKTHITFRIGGERCRPSGRGGSVSLKKLLQEKEIPLWYRDKIPLLYVNNEIAQVVGVKVCEGFQIDKDNSDQIAWIIESEYFA